MNEIRVLLVDDHAELRAGMRRLIDSQPDLQVAADVGGAREAVRAAAQPDIDVVVMDLSLPDGDGITATAEIVRRWPALRVLGLTRHEDPGYLQRMLAAGARGYLLKHNIAERLLAAIRIVAAGETYIDPHFANSRQAKPAVSNGVLEREKEPPAAAPGEVTADEVAVLQRVAWGHTNSEIAGELGMSVAAVVEHKARAMREIGLRTRIDVLRYAEAQGWIRDGPDAG